MIRERNIATIPYIPGGRSILELPKDAVYHQFQLALRGQVQSVNAGGATANQFYQGFPFSLISQIRLIRNGSDTVYQASGKMMAKECFFLNGCAPHARLSVGAAGGVFGAGNLLASVTVNGVVIPANAEGINENAAIFADAGTASTTLYTDFEALLELWLQLGSTDDKWWVTLLDARPLSSFQLEVTWANVTDVLVPGTATTISVINCAIEVNSYDQDGVATDQEFGTYKRSLQQISNANYGSSGVQYLLSRGNLFQGMIFETLAFKTGSTTIAQPENGVIGKLQNRINVNYYLRDVDFNTLQQKAKNDGKLNFPYQTGRGSPRGFAYLDLLGVGDRISDLVQTYTMDQYDFSLNIQPLANAQNGTTTGSTQPIINLLQMEVIPGRGIAPNMVQGSQNGSVAKTSASPYRSI